MSDAFDNLIERQSPPSTKAATEYLAASGATAISIIQTDGVCAFRIALKIDQDAISTHWLPEAVATPVVKSARHHAGKTTDIDATIAALHQAATDRRATLTPHAVALERAGGAFKRLDAYIGSMRRTGALVQFNKEYKRRRTEATESGSGFMTNKVALARLRTALISLLVGGQQLSVGSLRRR